MNTVFSDNLKKFRTQKNLTQEQVAEILGVNPQTVSRWECNTTLPDVLLLPQIARLYCVTVDDLFKANSSIYANYAQRLAHLYKQTHAPEDFVQADIEFRKLMRSDSYSAEDRRMHGVIHQFMMSYCADIANNFYQEIINNAASQDETYWRTRNHQVYLYTFLGMSEECINDQLARMEKHSVNAMEWVTLISAFFYAKRYEEGYRYFSEALAKFPKEHKLLRLGAEICRFLKRFDEAFKYLNKAEELNAHYYDIGYTRGFCYEDMGDWENAYKTWLSVVNMLKKDGNDIEAATIEKRANAALEKMDI